MIISTPLPELIAIENCLRNIFVRQSPNDHEEESRNAHRIPLNEMYSDEEDEDEYENDEDEE